MARAIFASIVATLVASALIYLNARVPLFTGSDFLVLVEAFNARIGLSSTERGAWVTHILLGTFVFGMIFAFLRPILPGRGSFQGLWFGGILWLAMMVSFMPLAGHQIFGQDLGPVFTAASLVFSLIYGAVLGMSYAAFGADD